MLAIIDYGAGNLHSVQKACEAVGEQVYITSNPEEILAADRVILPGVGAFGDCMQSLTESGLVNTMHQIIEQEKPFLGICLGMHMLFSSSEESPGVKGLDVFHGQIVRIPESKGLKIPQMGWNSLQFTKESPLFYGLPENPFVYFVHSYYMQPEDTSIIAATCEYGKTLPIALHHGNVFATQFHPEKSGDVGLKILKNFMEWGGAF
ncbi:MAG: imidazole glycerol phosphate synthase subunit HisH [Clostridia bacterium]|nr:imidazole glycerol phosphate synthase subunit HisH [Clostridia bacterium]